MEGITNNPLFGVIISLVAFEIGKFIFGKTKLAILNPLLIATVIVMGFLHFFHISVGDYMLGGNLIVFFLAPATVVLAIPLFQQVDLLKKHFIPILGGGDSRGCSGYTFSYNTWKSFRNRSSNIGIFYA